MNETSRNFGRVAVLMGGDSAEREISLMSGQAVFEALKRSGVDVFAVDTGKDFYSTLEADATDRVVIMLHGRNGEDGKVQAALDLMKLPYTGSGHLASALAMDKVLCKKLWLCAGLPTPGFRILTADSDWAGVIDELGTCFVKPVKEGSSKGISKAADADALQKAYRHAADFDDVVIAESRIKGAEYSVSILNDRILPPIELRAKNEFYDYEAKYFSDETEYLCPCDLDEEASEKIQTLARDAYDQIGCEGWGRVDLMRDENGEFWLLEVNTVPGMTSHSLVPMSAKAAGLNFDQLVLEILKTSYLQRH